MRHMSYIPLFPYKIELYNCLVMVHLKCRLPKPLKLLCLKIMLQKCFENLFRLSDGGRFHWFRALKAAW